VAVPVAPAAAAEPRIERGRNAPGHVAEVPESDAGGMQKSTLFSIRAVD
jgi:hypothetical protein